MSQFEDKIILKDIGQAQQIGGLADENIRAIEKRTGIRIVARGQIFCWAVRQRGECTGGSYCAGILIELSGEKELTSAIYSMP